MATPPMPSLTSCALAILAAAVPACSSPARSDAEPAATRDAAPAKPDEPTCRTDRDCTAGWHPGMPVCGPVDRCVEGRCRRPAAMTGRPDASTGRIVFETANGERAWQVEVVSTPFETARGLMCRETMRRDWGMLFLMPATRVQRFWMKNTLIPLDMVFLDEGWRVVGVVAGAEPRTLTGRGVDTPSRYVLELNAGEAARAGIEPGVRARFYPPAR